MQAREGKKHTNAKKNERRTEEKAICFSYVFPRVDPSHNADIQFFLYNQFFIAHRPLILLYKLPELPNKKYRQNK